MRIINKKYLLIILFVGVILTGVVILKPKEEVKLDNVVLKQEVNNKTFAMYKEDGESYVPVEGTQFPEGYVLNLNKSKCIDNNGDEIKNALQTEVGNVTLTTNKSSYCYLYFDNKISLASLCKGYNDMAQCIRENKNNLYKTYFISSTLYGDLYRYQGFENVENYVCFGTAINCGANTADINKYMYRILGITEDGNLKLVKASFLSENLSENEEVVFEFQNCTGDSCSWPNSNLFYRLNGTGTGLTVGRYGNSNIFINSMEYDYLNKNSDNNWLDHILDYNWQYGEFHNYTNNYDSNEVFEQESNFSNHSDNPVFGIVNAKIGLMYLHDVLFTYPSGNPKNRENAMNSWINTKYNSRDWNLYDNEWLLTRYGLYGDSSEISMWMLSQSNLANNAFTSHALGLRPVFYIKSNFEIIEGTGSIENPYILNYKS